MVVTIPAHGGNRLAGNGEMTRDRGTTEQPARVQSIEYFHLPISSTAVVTTLPINRHSFS